MGSGKSTLGHDFARRIRCRFVDMDLELERRHQLLIPQIFDKYGEEQFRLWETELLQILVKDDHLVVATGGGLPCFHKNMELLNNSGITIYLKLSPEIIFSRLSKKRENRPLIRNFDDNKLKEYILFTLSKRENFYLKAQRIVDAESVSVQDLITLTGLP
jgi:shikimate kinase